MVQASKAVFLDADVTPKVLSVITEAQKFVVFVTPYLDLWRHVEIAIEQAVKRGIDARFIVRADPKVTEGKDVEWLLNQRVKVFAVEGLHAKIYLNEKTTVLSSMNITEPSTGNSMEIAYIVRDSQDAQMVRDYVFKHLMSIAKPAGPAAKQATPPPTLGRLPQAVAVGACIRCGNHITLDPLRPLCGPCYDSWAEWSNPDYEENFCHRCGRRASVSHARPLCNSCYHAQR